MHILQGLWFFVSYFDMDVRCKHIPGVTNRAADHLYCDNLLQFFSLYPQASRQPSPLLVCKLSSLTFVAVVYMRETKALPQWTTFTAYCRDPTKDRISRFVASV